jgi:hypothetical protein
MLAAISKVYCTLAGGLKLNQGRYSSLVRFGKQIALLKGVKELTGVKISLKNVDQKIKAREATKKTIKSKVQPKFLFTVKWFAKLQLMPSIELEVTDSRSKIRRECYGFREKKSGERVYFKIDEDSIIEFRDSPSGALMGRRYLIPRISKIRGKKTWDKVNRLVGRMLSEQGIIVNAKLVYKYDWTVGRRKKLAELLISKRKSYLFDRSGKGYARQRQLKERRKREKAIKQVSESGGLVPVDDSWYFT